MSDFWSRSTHQKSLCGNSPEGPSSAGKAGRDHVSAHAEALGPSSSAILPQVLVSWCDFAGIKHECLKKKKKKTVRHREGLGSGAAGRLRKGRCHRAGRLLPRLLHSSGGRQSPAGASHELSAAGCPERQGCVTLASIPEAAWPPAGRGALPCAFPQHLWPGGGREGAPQPRDRQRCD